MSDKPWTKLAKEHKAAVLSCSIIYPDGEVVEYVRVLDEDHAAAVMDNKSLWQFYADDMRHYFKRRLANEGAV